MGTVDAQRLIDVTEPLGTEVELRTYVWAQRQYFAELYHSRVRQLAALKDEMEGIRQELASLRKLAGMSDKQL